MARPKYAASLQPRRVVLLVVVCARRLAHRRRTSVSASHTCPHRAARPRTATLAHEQCSVSAEPRALRGSGRSPCSDDARSRWWCTSSYDPPVTCSSRSGDQRGTTVPRAHRTATTRSLTPNGLCTRRQWLCWTSPRKTIHVRGTCTTHGRRRCWSILSTVRCVV